jgi:hypothetical protein
MVEDDGDDVRNEMVHFLKEGWMDQEPTFWESPGTLMGANADIERSDGRNPLTELMVIDQAMRHRVRPGILRLVWCMMLSAGWKRSMGEMEMNDPFGTLMAPTVFLRELVEERVPDFFDDRESTGLQAFLRHLRLNEKGSMADEVVRALAARTYWMVEGGAVMDLYLHQEGGVEIEEERISAWRTSAIHLSACLSAFNVMLVAKTVAAGSDVAPERFRETIGQKKKGQPSLTAASP